MKIALIGFEQAGKRTLFSLLTGRDVGENRKPGEVVEGIADIRDPRVDKLAELCQPEKVIYAQNNFVLCPDAVTGSGSREWLDAARRCDLMCLVVRAFESEQVYHPAGDVDAARDQRDLESEILLADMELVEKRQARLVKDKRSGLTADQKIEEKAIEKCMATLEDEKWVSEAGLNEQELGAIRSLDLLTLLPVMVARNVSEDAVAEGVEGAVAVSCQIEQEIAAIEDATERQEYLDSLGLDALGVDRVNAAAYDAMRKNLGLNGYPALAMILPEGGLLHKFGGYLKMTPFKAELAKALANKPAVLASDAYKAKLAVRKKADAEFAAYAAKADKTSGAYLNKAMHYYLGMQYPTDATRAAKTLAKVDPKCKVGTPKDVALRANLIYQAAKIPEEKTAAFALLKKADKDGAFGYLAPAWMAKADAMLHAGYDKKTNAVAPDKAKAALVEINGILKLKTVPNAYMMQSMKHYAATQAKDVPAQIEALKAIKVLHPPAAEKIDQMLKELQPKPAK